MGEGTRRCHVGEEWTDKAWREHANGRSTCWAHTLQAGGVWASLDAINQHRNVAGRPGQAGGRQKPRPPRAGLLSPPVLALEAPFCLHYTDGETEAQRGARWLRNGWP